MICSICGKLIFEEQNSMTTQTTRVRPYLLIILIILLTLTTTARRARVKALSCTANPVVTTNADSGAGSLREAIANACDGSTITFANSVVSPIVLASELAIDKNLTIQGPGANALTISGNNAVRVFNIGSVNPAIDVTLSGLTIANGKPRSLPFAGGGILNNAVGTSNGGNNGVAAVSVTNSVLTGNATAVGGGVFNAGTMLITDSTVSSNTSEGKGGGIENLKGLMIIQNSTINGNASDGDAGGAISNDFSGTLSITNSTLTGNTADHGGGVSNTVAGTITITNTTIAGNLAGFGGGIFNTLADPVATVSLRNTIVALNSAPNGPDVLTSVGGSFTSQGHNLIGIGGVTGLTNGVNGDHVGSVASPLDPKLGPLANNGGPTFTQALLAGSPAIDAGDDSVLSSPLFLTTDQRGPGFPRLSGAHVDIGAFEFQVPVVLSFDTCLRDNTTGNLLQWSSTTGAYKFSRCSDGFMVAGTGVAKLVNGIRTLTDFKTDRRLSAGFNTGQRTGNATIYLQVAGGVWQSFQIVDTNPNAVCACPG
jgi:hypothetical protein